MIKDAFSYLKGIGWFELLLASIPIIGPYTYGPIYVSYILLVALSIWSLFRKRTRINLNPLIFLAVFFIIHEMVYIVMLDFNSTRINNDLSVVLHLLTTIIIIPTINYEKLEKSLMVLGIVSMLGMVYSFIDVTQNGFTTPIEIPFLPSPSESSRLYDEGWRPTSFFFEPASYVGYMLVPMFIALHRRYMILFAAFLLSMFLSSSSTGIFVSIIMVGVYVLTQKGSKSYKFVVIASALLAIYLLNTSELFEIGANKLEHEDYGSNARLNNGLILMSKLDGIDFIFGMPYANVYDFAYQTKTYFSENSLTKIFIPTFWSLISSYGVFFLLAYLNIYYQLYKRNRHLLPYLVPIVVTMFSSPTAMSSSFAYHIMFLFTFVWYYRNTEMEQN